MTTLHLPFLAAVSLAATASLIGQVCVRKMPFLQRAYIPEPLFGGLLITVGFFVLRLRGVVVQIPVAGSNVDFLVGLITTNMGLHITPRIFRNGFPLFLLFWGFGLLLCIFQFIVVLPVALSDPFPIHTALLAGPLSFVGAPFNLNPPSQTDPLVDLFKTAYPNLKSVAQGVMMIGVVGSVLGASVVGKLLFKRAAAEPPKPSPAESRAKLSLGRYAADITHLVTLILGLITVAFALQQLLMYFFPGLRDDYIPVIVLSFLLGALFRLVFTTILGDEKFPEQALTVILLGPTMNIVLAYAIMGIPLHHLFLLSPRLVISALLAIACSISMAWLAFPVLARFTNRYYAAVIATAFLAITTGWGPMGMSFLRRFIDEEGPVEPMPVIMPLNAFFLFPWMVILFVKLILYLAG